VDEPSFVVENVERNIALDTNPMKLRAAPWQEVSGPIVAIAFGVCAVFVPTAFIVWAFGTVL